MPLKDIQLKALKPAEKVYRVTDNEGLCIEVKPTGVKIWRYRYRFANKSNMISLGEYPTVSLKDARDKAQSARELLAQGVNPSDNNKAKKAELIAQKAEHEKAAFTFNDAFNAWYELKAQEWKPKHAQAIEGRYRLWLHPSLGKIPLSDITVSHCIKTIKRIEDTGKLESRDKARSLMGQIFRYSVSTGQIASSPFRDLSSDIFIKHQKNNFAHQTDPASIKEVYKAVTAPYSGYITTSNAMKLLPLTFLRVTELTGLKWDEVDLSSSIIRINAERMKMKRDHIVPLSRQAIAILKDQHEYHTGGVYVFPSTLSKTRPITGETLLTGMRRQGIDKTVFSNHGWRHSASTILHELGYTPHAIEAQLSHIIKGVAGIYNKALYLEERTRMMQAWADWLEGFNKS